MPTFNLQNQHEHQNAHRSFRFRQNLQTTLNIEQDENKSVAKEYSRSLRLSKGTMLPQSLFHGYRRKDLSCFCTNETSLLWKFPLAKSPTVILLALVNNYLLKRSKFRTKWTQKIKVGISLHSVLELFYFSFLSLYALSWMVVHKIIVSFVSRASLPFWYVLFFSFLRGSGNGIEKMKHLRRNPLWQYAI